MLFPGFNDASDIMLFVQGQNTDDSDNEVNSEPLACKTDSSTQYSTYLYLEKGIAFAYM